MYRQVCSSGSQLGFCETLLGVLWYRCHPCGNPCNCPVHIVPSQISVNQAWAPAIAAALPGPFPHAASGKRQVGTVPHICFQEERGREVGADQEGLQQVWVLLPTLDVPDCAQCTWGCFTWTRWWQQHPS